MKEEIVLLKIQNTLDEGLDFYEATRHIWRINKERAIYLQYAVGVNRGKVECVFEINKWYTEKNGQGKEGLSFEGIEGPVSLLNKLKGRTGIILKKFGSKNPVTYLSLSELENVE